VVDVVGLGGGDQDAIDAPGEEVGEDAAAAGRKQARMLGQRTLQVRHRGRAGVQRLHGIDQHDLPVEAGDVLAEERLYDMRLVGLVAALHHGAQRARLRAALRQGGSGAKVSAGEPSRSPGIRNRPGGSVESARLSCLHGPQVGGEALGKPARRHLVGGRVADRFGTPPARATRDRSCADRQFGEVERFPRELRVALAQQWRSSSHSPG
jgi:hypothetical protein